MFFPIYEFGDNGFYGSIRPRSRYQYDVQKGLGDWFEPYGNWMEGKSKDAFAFEGLQKFGLDFSDIKYPWVASLSGGSTAASLGGSLSQVSTNIMDLYNSRDSYDARQAKRQHQKYKDRLKYGGFW